MKVQLEQSSNICLLCLLQEDFLSFDYRLSDRQAGRCIFVILESLLCLKMNLK